MKKRIFLIRHGEVPGNREQRYVGSTDEALLPEAAENLRKKREAVAAGIPGGAGEKTFSLYVSPLLRCRQTAELLFPGAEQIVVPDLREMDFGRFEYRNYRELSGDPDYQHFIDTNGESGFPGGETKAAFTARCAGAFRALAPSLPEVSAFVVHGGTIMAILGVLSEPHGDYFTWHVPCGEGFSAFLEERDGGRAVCLTGITRFPEGGKDSGGDEA